jgi:hypothetical protein
MTINRRFRHRVSLFQIEWSLPTTNPDPDYEIESKACWEQHRSNEFARYEDYLNCELPRLIQRELEIAVQRPSVKIEDIIKSQLVEIVQRCQSQLFMSYQRLFGNSAPSISGESPLPRPEGASLLINDAQLSPVPSSYNAEEQVPPFLAPSRPGIVADLAIEKPAPPSSESPALPEDRSSNSGDSSYNPSYTVSTFDPNLTTELRGPYDPLFWNENGFTSTTTAAPCDFLSLEDFPDGLWEYGFMPSMADSSSWNDNFGFGLDDEFQSG